MLTYIFMLMTSWAIVCDVYYLDPTSMEVRFIIIQSLNERFESITKIIIVIFMTIIILLLFYCC